MREVSSEVWKGVIGRGLLESKLRLGEGSKAQEGATGREDRSLKHKDSHRQINKLKASTPFDVHYLL